LNGSTTNYSADQYAPKTPEQTTSMAPPPKSHDFEAPEPEKVYRSHDAPRATQVQGDADRDLAKAMQASLDRMERVTETLAKAMASRNAPAAAISSPMPERKDFEQFVDAAIAQRRLHKTVLANGDISYSLPIENPWDVVAATVSDREAFVEHGPTLTGAPAHIEITSDTERAILASMIHAKAKWGDDAIIIHANEKHAERVVKHAVAQGLTIANKDPRILELVAIERERQASPLARVAHERDTPMIERVASRERETSTGRER
jgi:hypothetical protein